MFTGIVEEVGKIISSGSNMKIAAHIITEDMKTGDSIAVNGICLTVTSFTNDSFNVDVMPETISKTSLSALEKNSSVNLERAMQIGGRFGGHIVTGHIDGTGKILSYRKDNNAIWLEVETDRKILKYIAPKGSVAIDGTSLTVVDSNSHCFTVSLIPHTSSVTTLTSHKVGDRVNLEADLLAKYMNHILNFNEKESGIDMLFLEKCGF